jgi:ABC-2 type transport system ATP-binding protein
MLTGMGRIKHLDRTVSIAAGGLTKRFGAFTAVRDLSLTIGRGEIYGFLGLNGAGKTATIRMLLGMIKPSAGGVSLFGKMVRPGQKSIWEQVGYMVETPHAYPDLTVRQNLEVFRHLRQLSDTGAVDKIIDKMGLAKDANRRTRTLSLGNAQRLGLAKALIHEPSLLILDEPANGLDPAGIVEIRNLLRDLAENKGVTIFMSSHILSEVTKLATRIGIVHQGRLVKEFEAGELAEEEEPRLMVDVRDAASALPALQQAGVSARAVGKNSLMITDKKTLQRPDEVAAILVRAGCPPTRLVIEQGDLESYFLRLVGLKEENKR